MLYINVGCHKTACETAVVLCTYHDHTDVNSLVYINVDITNDRDSYTIRTHYKLIDICGKPTRRPIWHSIGGIRSCVSEREQCRRVQRADISRYSPRRYTG